jgi:hypothetical protein
MGHSNSKIERTAIKLAKYMETYNCLSYYGACSGLDINTYNIRNEMAEIFAEGYHGQGILAQYKKIIRKMNICPDEFTYAINKYKRKPEGHFWSATHGSDGKLINKIR